MVFVILSTQIPFQPLSYKKQSPSIHIKCERITPMITKTVKKIHFFYLSDLVPLLSTFATTKIEKMSKFFSQFLDYMIMVDISIFSQQKWSDYVFPSSSKGSFDKTSGKISLQKGNRLIPFFLLPLVLDFLKIDGDRISQSFNGIDNLSEEENLCLNANINFVKSRLNFQEHEKERVFVENRSLKDQVEQLKNTIGEKNQIIEMLEKEKKNLLISVKSLMQNQE